SLKRRSASGPPCWPSRPDVPQRRWEEETMTEQGGAPVGASELRRSLGLVDLVLLAIGTVIGSGIFLVPAVVLRQTGGETGSAMIVWIVAGVLSLLGALTYAELGAMKPEAGGLYAYIRDAFGP